MESLNGPKRKMCAVGDNTFRGFHRLRKDCPGAKKDFVRFFVDEQSHLIAVLSSVRTGDQLDKVSDRVCAGVRRRLSNVSPEQLKSYNKVRKPVDLYFEHLVAMALELDKAREFLMPLLFLPLDSQMLRHESLFSDEELVRHGLSRRSTYKDIKSKETYNALQKLLNHKARVVTAGWRRAFHRIYFDLLWGGRYRNRGGNLFETNP